MNRDGCTLLHSEQASVGENLSRDIAVLQPTVRSGEPGTGDVHSVTLAPMVPLIRAILTFGLARGAIFQIGTYEPERSFWQ